MTKSESMTNSRHSQLHMLGWVAVAMVGALLLALFLTETWTMFWLALMVFMLLIMMTMLPALLAVLSTRKQHDAER